MSRVERIWLPGRMPGLNDLMFKGIGARIRFQKAPKRAVLLLVQAQGIKPFNGPVALSFEWVEPNKRRDPDGICSGGSKTLIDALKTCGVIANDGWKHIAGIAHSWRCDPQNPGVLVTIKEVA